MILGMWLPTMLPTSVEPRTKAKRTGLQPPWLNSLEVIPVPPRSWRLSMGLAAARPARAAIRMDFVYILSTEANLNNWEN